MIVCKKVFVYLCQFRHACVCVCVCVSNGWLYVLEFICCLYKTKRVSGHAYVRICVYGSMYMCVRTFDYACV
jgi:hypothetical protein